MTVETSEPTSESHFTSPPSQDGSTAIAFRHANPDDAEAISTLIRTRSSALSYGPPAEFEIWFDARYSVAMVLDRIRNPDCTNLVLVENGYIIGCAYIDLSTGYLGGLHVARDGDGLGTLLIEARLNLARTAGLDRVWMGINDSNKRMIRHAHRHGFTYEGPSPTDRWPFTRTASNRYEKFLRTATV